MANKFENFIRWMVIKVRLQDKFNRNDYAKWKVNRGDLYTCHFGENIGYEKSRLEARPCVIISSDLINHDSGNIIVAPLSKTIKYKDNSNELKYGWNYVLFKRNYPKLQYDSMVQCEDMRCVSKARLGSYIGYLNDIDQKNLKKRIKKALQA